MTIKKMKEEIINYTDFYGGDVLGLDEVGKATTKKELYDILEKHRTHMEDMLCDANSHLDDFKKRIGLC